LRKDQIDGDKTALTNSISVTDKILSGIDMHFPSSQMFLAQFNF